MTRGTVVRFQLVSVFFEFLANGRLFGGPMHATKDLTWTDNRLPSGHLTDLVNRTRAKDAAARISPQLI
jgi:hypothetical protein